MNATSAQFFDVPPNVLNAIYTACSEIPNAHHDDIADCVCGIIGISLFEQHEDAIVELIQRYV